MLAAWLLDGIIDIYFFFFKQKTAYEVRISDWSSDVCSSDLVPARSAEGAAANINPAAARGIAMSMTTIPFEPRTPTVAVCTKSFTVECCPERSIFSSQVFWRSSSRANSRLLPTPVLRRAERKRSLIEVSERPKRAAKIGRAHV